MNTSQTSTHPVSVLAESKSEVARLRTEIDLQVESAKQALHGLAQGTVRHEVITLHMQRFGQYSEDLKDILGDDAMPYIIQKLDQLNELAQSQTGST